MATDSISGVATTVTLVEPQRRREQRRALRRFFRNPMATCGLAILTLLVAASVAAPLITSDDPEHGRLIDARQEPSRDHIFGTDQIGRDVFARVLYGGRVSLGISVIAVAISVMTGASVGSFAAYRGGWLDILMQRLVEIMLAFPGLLLALAIVTALGRGMQPLIAAVVIASVPLYIRLVRSSILSIREQAYVEAARALGATDLRIVFSHVLPNAVTPMLVQATLQLAGVLLTVSSLSFLGLGINPPTPEWGGMVADGRAYLRSASYLVWFPGAALALAVLGFNLFGDGIRDALDSKDTL